MTQLDVHPEALLDREARGELTSDERRYLDAHLAQCVACRLERQLRADFDAELGAVSRDDAQDLVSSALLAAVSSATQSAETPSAQGTPRRPTTSRRVALLVAATLLFVSGLAFAQTELAMRVITIAREAVGLASNPSPHPDVANAEATQRKRAVEAKKPVASASPPTAQASTASTPPTPAPIVIAEREAPSATTAPTPAPRARGTDAREQRRAPVPAATNVREATVVVTPSDAPTPEPHVATTMPAAVPETPDASSAASLFDRAGRARRSGQVELARELYRELAARYPGSPEALTSLVVAARLDLDRGDARAALAGFDAYLTSAARGLREQALVGRAQALRKLGLEDAERESLRALAREYPDAPYLRTRTPESAGAP